MDNFIEGLRDNAWNGIIGIITIIGLLITGARYLTNKDNQKTILQNGLTSTQSIIRFLSKFLLVFVKVFTWLFTFPQALWVCSIVGFVVALKTNPSIMVTLPKEIPFSLYTGSATALILFLLTWSIQAGDNGDAIDYQARKIAKLEKEISQLKSLMRKAEKLSVENSDDKAGKEEPILIPVRDSTRLGWVISLIALFLLSSFLFFFGIFLTIKP